MRIAIIGFGEMGKLVYEAALHRGHLVEIIVDKHNRKASFTKLTVAALSRIDIAIDFSSGGSALEHLDICAGAGVDLVMGTTGWDGQLSEAKRIVKENDIGFLWSDDFSRAGSSAEEGAVKVAEWLNQKKGFFEMSDFLK